MEGRFFIFFWGGLERKLELIPSGALRLNSVCRKGADFRAIEKWCVAYSNNMFIPQHRSDIGR